MAIYTRHYLEHFECLKNLLQKQLLDQFTKKVLPFSFLFVFVSAMSNHISEAQMHEKKKKESAGTGKNFEDEKLQLWDI